MSFEFREEFGAGLNGACRATEFERERQDKNSIRRCAGKSSYFRDRFNKI